MDNYHNKVIHGDCIEVMKTMPDNMVDSIITDPPYGLSFMGKKWDNFSDYYDWCVAWSKEALRVAKPGAILLCFGGTRTYHRLTCAIEDTGWEIRDCLMWLYGSGFPKSFNISKAIDKRLGATRNVVGTMKTNTKMQGNNFAGEKPDKKGGVVELTEPASNEAKLWDGWGTALKPAYEPIILAMKPVDKSFVDNALNHGVSGINITDTRIPSETRPLKTSNPKPTSNSTYSGRMDGSFSGGSKSAGTTQEGRWPTNVILDEESVHLLDQQTGIRKSGGKVKGTEPSHTGQTGIFGTYKRVESKTYDDLGGASRFFYCAKASSSERNAAVKNNHPTVKPLKLMEYLCKLTKTPIGGLVFDPFGGSGTTALAAKNTKRPYLVIEKEVEYIKIIQHRIVEYTQVGSFS